MWIFLMPAEVCLVWLVYCVTETRRLKTDPTTAASPVLLRQSAEAELWLPLVAGQPSTVSEPWLFHESVGPPADMDFISF